MPDLKGLNLSSALNLLNKIKINGRQVSPGRGVISYVYSNTMNENHIIDQNPEFGSNVAPWQKINFLVSTTSKKDNDRMPNVTGQNIDLCYNLLISKGLLVSEEILPTGKISKSGVIISQSPYKRSRFEKGDRIKLKILYYPHNKGLYTAYEKFEYKVPADLKAGIYEAHIEDDGSDRIRFSGNVKPGKKIRFVFKRHGNANVIIRSENKIIKEILVNREN